MRYLSLFSGIEAASVAWHPLGWECAGVSEIEPFPCAVLAHHYPTTPNLGDVTKITEEDIAALGRIDLVVFGSPCQDLSVAGLRKGFICESTDTLTRSGLFFVAMRIVAWARQHGGCRFALWENVPGAFSSSQGRDFAAVVGAMAGLEDVPVPPRGWGNEGVAVGTEGLVEWATLDAQHFGVAQRRRRVFALADFGNWSNRPPILLEPESLRGDTAPRREAGQDTATEPGSCLDVSRIGTLTAGFVNAAFGAKQGLEDQHAFQGAGLFVPDVTHSLRGEGVDASEDGTGRGTPLVPTYAIQGNMIGRADHAGPSGQGISEELSFTQTKTDVHGVAYGIRTANTSSNGWGIQENVTHTLDQAMGVAVAQPIGFNARQEPDSWADRTGPLDTDGSTQAIAFSSKDYGNDATADLSPTLRSLGAYNANGGGNMAVAVSLRGREGGATAELGDEVGNCLRASSGGGDKAHVLAPSFTASNDPSRSPQSSEVTQQVNAVLQASMQVRRLTPVECARLQGFPDTYLDITFRNKQAADGNKYKALGNSMAVPVMHWIGKKIKEAVA